MARVLLMHHDPAAREMLRLMACGHSVDVVSDVASAKRKMVQNPPEVILISQDNRQEHATALLTWMRANRLDTPVIAVLGRTGAAHKPALRKLGAVGTLEHPMDRSSVDRQIAAALAVAKEAAAGPPPITPEELNTNLSVLENALNRRMHCTAGRNQVFIQSVVMGTTTTKPRICLRCPLRAEYGMPREVYYEFIRDVCCAEPLKCEAARRFAATRETA